MVKLYQATSLNNKNMKEKKLIILLAVAVFIACLSANLISNGLINRSLGATSKTVMYNGSNPYFLGNLGIGTNDPSYSLDVLGTFNVSTGSSTFDGGVQGKFYSNDGTAGLTDSCASSTAITIKNGLITACS